MENETTVDETTTTVPVKNNEVAEATIEAPETVQEQPVIDYAAENERLKEQLSKAEFTLYKKNKALQEAKRGSTENKGYIDPEEIRQLVEDQAVSLLQAQREKDSEDILQEELQGLSQNEDERTFIQTIYENRIQKTGYSRLAIRQDLQEAKILANAPKIIRASQEKSEILKARGAMSSTGTGTNQDRPETVKNDPFDGLTAYEIQFMRSGGASDETIKQAAAKKKSGILTEDFRK